MAPNSPFRQESRRVTTCSPAARSFVLTPAGGAIDPRALTHADHVPDYTYAVGGGVTYGIDTAQPAGSRVTGPRFAGEPVADDAEFVLAVNNYRANGGNFPHIAGAERIWSDSDEIRDTLIDWARTSGRIDPAAFASVDWRLTRDGAPVF
ncbi:5'-nucleotidase C-terminal domain-containing protein [Streptomyces sp. NBC_01803]|uniref:5'-nucleotidase C-terminal domain-containing protein n=1 Tax=Streptomyces sp. NBC_01803 TaxID=2975946 RepID=UPI003FA355A8